MVRRAAFACCVVSLLACEQHGEPEIREASAAEPTAPAEAAAPASTSTSGAASAVPEGMVKIPAGVFFMGANHAVGNPEEKPGHEGIVASFLLDAKEVRFGDYQRCVKAGACTQTHQDNQFCNLRLEGHDDHPVNCIDLRQAAAYCSWAGKRLPTEREWEYAASGGKERRRFSWGDDDPTQANSCYDHPGGSCPVGSFAPGAFGLYDMNGNVWEWTQSKFVPYPTHASPDSIEDGEYYVYRGGSWSRRFPKWMRNLTRNRYFPNKYSASIGMRCARSITPLECPAETSPDGDGCKRSRGTPVCEPMYRHDGTRCVPDPNAGTSVAAGEGDPSQLGVPQAGADAQKVAASISRTRTPSHDADCKQHWPATPAAYLFKGGPSYASRKPMVSAAGCVPRDMGATWTSACCGG